MVMSKETIMAMMMMRKIIIKSTLNLSCKVQKYEIIVKQKDYISSSHKNINLKSLNKCSYLQFCTDNDGPQFSKDLAESL
jgi:hypothetical protein